MQEFILNYYEIFLKVHFIGFIIGLGAATISDILFFKFLKDFKIDKFEADTLHTISKIVWGGVGLFTISGICLFIGKYDLLVKSSSFLSKMTIVAVVIMNGIFLHFNVSPKLRKLKLIGKVTNKDMILRTKALIGGVISVTSWYSVLFLAINKGYGFKYPQIMGFYILVLGAGILGAIILSRLLNLKDQKKF